MAGDSVAVVSPSWGGPSCYQWVLDRGIEALREVFGLRVVEYDTARATDEELRRSPWRRAEEINQTFADVSISGIMASIGGNDSVRTLPFIDVENALANPKVLTGFSDTTTLLSYLSAQGLVTFNGPSVMAGFAQTGSFPDEFTRHVRALLFEDSAGYVYRPFEWWVDGYPKWDDPTTTGQVNEHHAAEGWRWLQGSGVHEDRLWGGCFDVREMMKGTRFWPGSGFWEGRVLFLETSELAPSPTWVTGWLRNYGMQGVFDAISALLIGRPMRYATDAKTKLDAAVQAVVAQEFGRPDLPIVTNMDFGHTDPRLIMPSGVGITVDCDQQVIALTESATVG